MSQSIQEGQLFKDITLIEEYYRTKYDADLAFSYLADADEDFGFEPIENIFLPKPCTIEFTMAAVVPDDEEIGEKQGEEMEIENVGNKQEPIVDVVGEQNSFSDEPLSDDNSISQPHDVKNYEKNFMVLLSGWIKSYLLSLKGKIQNFDSIYQRFQSVVKPPKSQITSNPKKGQKQPKRRRKVYINLKKLSILFNDEEIKYHLSNFFQTWFLRKLAVSTTRQKSCLLRFLPVLKQGLIQGRISRLR